MKLATCQEHGSFSVSIKHNPRVVLEKYKNQSTESSCSAAVADGMALGGENWCVSPSEELSKALHRACIPGQDVSLCWGGWEPTAVCPYLLPWALHFSFNAGARSQVPWIFPAFSAVVAKRRGSQQVWIDALYSHQQSFAYSCKLRV